jgi:uncharacterized protein YecE (DUF72 family)
MGGSGKQLSLFDEPPPAQEVVNADSSLPGLDRDRSLARELPAHVRFGTSSWTFPGWAGLVYPGRPTERELTTRGLGLYARYPLFSTVGIDRSYYRPLTADVLRDYAAQLPTGYPCVIKVWSQITSVWDRHRDQPNPSFLDPELFEQEVAEPLREHFREHVGALVFELAPIRGLMRSDVERVLQGLRRLFAQSKRGLPFAVELRNRELLTPAYFELLQEFGVSHVINYWERMPDVGQQLELPGALSGDPVVVRLLIPPGERYADRKRELAPFNRIVEPQHKMRHDVVRLSELCEKLGKALFVIVNNKAEGSSPLTVRALIERLLGKRRERLTASSRESGGD